MYSIEHHVQRQDTMILGYDYTHWLIVGSLALLTAAPVIGIAAGFIMSRLRRRRAAQ